jgi:AcrR family transcriptional regulator
MAAPTRTPRSQWIEHGLKALAAGGPNAVRIEPIAQALGVTRGGFYWHFDDRNALLGEMLDTWERRSTEEVIERVEREGGDPMSKARRAGALTFSGELLPIDLAVRDWSRREPAVAERLRRVDNRRMDYLRSQLATVCADQDELEARCLIAFSVAIGTHFIAADHGTRSRADVLELVTRRLFAQHAGPVSEPHRETLGDDPLP